jgi:hypothetical protein
MWPVCDLLVRREIKALGKECWRGKSLSVYTTSYKLTPCDAIISNTRHLAQFHPKACVQYILQVIKPTILVLQRSASTHHNRLYSMTVESNGQQQDGSKGSLSPSLWPARNLSRTHGLWLNLWRSVGASPPVHGLQFSVNSISNIIPDVKVSKKTLRNYHLNQ